MKSILKRLEHAKSSSETVEILSNIEQDKLYELLRDVSHEYLISGESRSYMGYVLHTSTKHRIYIDPNGLVVHKELGSQDETYLPHDLCVTIYDTMELMFDQCDDVEE